MPVHKDLKQHKVLLDTHVWIWLMLGETSLSRSFKEAVKRNKSSDWLFVSAISVWEVGMLVERGRISLEIDCLEWVEQALAPANINLIPITPRIAIQSSRLPGTMHGDPADRILVATAYEHSAILATHDKKILEYGKDNFVSVYDPL